MRYLCVLLFAVLLSPTAAEADDACGGLPNCTVEDGPGSISVDGEGNVPGSTTDSTVGGSGASGPTDLVGNGLDAVCVLAAIERGLDPYEYCGIPADGGTPEGITPGLVLAALQRIPLPPPELQVQPPNGRTLVNFETNFFTESPALRLTVPILGSNVQLRIRPVQYTWDYGDGSSETTATPGAAYPDLQVTHVYERRGPVRPTVATTFAAQYRANGTGPWLDVDGTVTVAGAPQDLQVLTATPVLVGYGG